MVNYKPEFRVANIGRFRFYSGILVGAGYSVILTFLFRMLTKTNNISIALNRSNWDNLLSSSLNFYYSFFFGLLSVSLGFCMTIYLWSATPIPKKNRSTRSLRWAQTNSIFMFGVILLVLTRFFTIYLALNYDGFDLDLEKYLGFSAFLLPLFLFLYCWSLISKNYRTKKAFLISILVFVICGLLLGKIDM